MKSFADYGIEVSGIGPEVYATCPQCSPTRKKKNAKCLSVNLEKEVWYCAHCDWRGSLKQGVQQRPALPNRTTYVKPEWVDRTPEAKLKAVLQKRRISVPVAERARLRVESVWFPALETFADAVQFPYVRRGEVVNIKSRAIEAKEFRQVGGAEKVLYGLDDIDTESVVIVEGEFDKLALAMAGFWSCVSVPDGAPAKNARATDKKFEYLANCEAELSQVKQFILATDADEPGQQLAEELARRLGTERCARVKWPIGVKDANDFLMQDGPDALGLWMKQHMELWPIEEVKTTSEMADEVLEYYRNGEHRGLDTGWNGLDELYTIGTGQLTIVTGVPSHGKSEFIDALMVNLAEQHGWMMAVCSPENLPVSRHVAKLAEKHVRKPFFPGTRERMSPFECAQALQWIHDHFLWIVPDEAMSIDALLTKTKALIFRHGVRGLVIDPWNEFEHRRQSGETETEYISRVLGQLTRFARRTGIHIWLVAHPSKLYRKEDGTYPVPTPYDISGSAHWRNKATNCLCVWRDDSSVESTRVEIHVQKVRFKSFGRQGMMSLEWDRATGCYREEYEVAYGTH